MSIVERLEKEPTLPTTTLIFSTVFVAAYISQLLLVGSLSQNAGIEAARVVKNVVGTASAIFTWVFHSNHTHFLENLFVFVLAGWWVENRIDQRRFFLGIVFILGIGANVAAAMVFGTLGIGISGITSGLATMVALGHLEALQDADSQFVRNVVAFTLSGVFLLWVVGAIEPLPAGTAVEIHILGVGIGAMWFAVEKSRHGFSYRL
ncbi:rhomboid family intramembrane serine protease [Halorubrum ezzemoulense]|uniref:Rhomboid family intramembrane serine protease n=1 Tax=Halorubrum ezzemoulense TaxID=337243 RepID=A0ABT4Z7K5_HALEZ|nr:rhomboid family intramembrane serine protease [Halorubrum ezzemoulense]MDB2294166.1 rhomboid family intramembrane serine protease [Halorubrum ezzemoulense]